MRFVTKHLKLLSLFFLTLLFAITTAIYAEEPIQIGTKTEDISLTDDINIARAQVEKYPNNAEAHFNLAIALSRTSWVEEAIKELRKTKLLIRKNGGIELINKKITEYKEMLNSDPSTSALNNIRYRLAFSYYLKAYLINKEIEKAKKSTNPNSSKKDKNILFKEKGLLITNSNPHIKENLELSISYFKELLNLNPNDSWAKVYYAFILAEQMNDVNKARELWNEVIKDNPNNPAPHFFIGELHIKEGNLKEGIVEISEAVLLRSLGN